MLVMRVPSYYESDSYTQIVVPCVLKYPLVFFLSSMLSLPANFLSFYFLCKILHLFVGCSASCMTTD